MIKKSKVFAPFIAHFLGLISELFVSCKSDFGEQAEKEIPLLYYLINNLKFSHLATSYEETIK